MTTTSRLLTLLSLLQTRRDWPGAVLAERLEISHRTVRRDIDRLREMGYRIDATMGPDGGYRLDAGNELPPLLFDDDQVVALTLALQAASVTGAGIEEAALRALTTVRQVMPSRLRHRLNALEFTALPAGPGQAEPSPATPEVLLTLSAAVRARAVVRFDYARGAIPSVADAPVAPVASNAPGTDVAPVAPVASVAPGTPVASVASDQTGSARDSLVPELTRSALDGATPEPARRVEPHHLVTVAGRWYLVAWDLDRDGWRLFRVDRITPRTPSGPRFTPREVPGGDVSAFVSARFKGSERENVWPCTGTVILALPARDVRPFVGDGTLTDLGPGRCRLEAGSWSWVSLAAALCRFDCAIEVVGPPELRDAFATLATRTAAAAR
ncbi:putative DNA-binding transcriptional regulator YafY [Mycetocola sp. BIGb0189]|uniref:helix-turn-helix transcriptional regulator n=1 Tax=Mycetocola sp. BIGb0189 TaxID=2940604 RepID=UPI0021699068|nr:WYL domain-containing protein [Mycetocola sp. BIGb0189]MCS4277679.1 putative DNA-binding transcriptional regulator YafY [Mycetocola sp. BIGb0189]